MFCNDLTEMKVKKFMQKNFIPYRMFASDDKRFLLKHLVMKEDLEIEKRMKETALDNQERLKFEVNKKSQELTAINRKVKLSLSQHKIQVDKIKELELERDELRGQVNAMQKKLDEMKSQEVSMVDSVNGTVAEKLHKAQGRMSSTNEDMPLQQQLDGLRQESRLSSCSCLGLNVLADKVKEFLGETCKVEFEFSSANDSPMQKLESCVVALMIQTKGMVLEKDIEAVDEKEHLAELNLKDKLNETRKQKAVMKSELFGVLKRLEEITKELEAEKDRVKHLETEIQNRDTWWTPSRAETPVQVHLPVLVAQTPKSVPSGILKQESLHNEVDSAGDKLFTRRSKPKQKCTPVLSRKSARPKPTAASVQYARSTTVCGPSNVKMKQGNRYHPSNVKVKQGHQYHPSSHAQPKNPKPAKWCGNTLNDSDSHADSHYDSHDDSSADSDDDSCSDSDDDSDSSW